MSIRDLEFSFNYSIILLYIKLCVCENHFFCVYKLLNLIPKRNKIKVIYYVYIQK